MDELYIKDINNYIDDLTEKISKVLKPKRLKHSISVCDTAANLAMRYKADIDRARIAGILHDCAKCYKGDDIIKRCMDIITAVLGIVISSPVIKLIFSRRRDGFISHASSMKRPFSFCRLILLTVHFFSLFTT